MKMNETPYRTSVNDQCCSQNPLSLILLPICIPLAMRPSAGAADSTRKVTCEPPSINYETIRYNLATNCEQRNRSISPVSPSLSTEPNDVGLGMPTYIQRYVLG